MLRDPMSTKLYYCDNRHCRYNTPFADGSLPALAFRKALGIAPQDDLDGCIFCSCEDGTMLHTDQTVVGNTSLLDRPPLPPPAEYGALILCADLSGSMMGRRPANQAGSRIEAVIQAFALLLRELAGKGDGYSAAGRRAHYNHLLIAVVRYAQDCNVFRLGDQEDSPVWFTLQQLAEHAKWGFEDTGDFKKSDVLATVREHLLPMKQASSPKIDSVVKPEGTNLALAIKEVAKLSQQLMAARQGAPGLPLNFGQIGQIPAAAGRKKLYAVIYTDGEVPNPKLELEAAKALDRDVPDLLRITVFLGDPEKDDKQGGGGVALLQAIASRCYATSHGEDAPQAYFPPEKAGDLRKVIRMATVSNLGLCPVCMDKQASS